MIFYFIIILIIFLFGFNIFVVSGCLLKGFVFEFNKWCMMIVLFIILLLVGRMIGLCMSVIISGFVMNKRSIYNYNFCCKVVLLKRENEGFCFSYL